MKAKEELISRAPEEAPDLVMPLSGHLDELRTRILRILGALVLAFLFCFWCHVGILRLLVEPAGARSFVITHPSEAFMTSLRLSFFAALLLVAPLLLVEGWAFVRPGLRKVERRFLRWVAPLSATLFLSAALAGYLAMPLLLNLLTRGAPTWVEAMLSIGRYATFSLTAMLVCGLLAQIPLLFAVAWAAGFVHSRVIERRRGAAWIAIGIATAMLAPPDLLSKVALALPLIGLYEGMGCLLRLFGR